MLDRALRLGLRLPSTGWEERTTRELNHPRQAPCNNTDVASNSVTNHEQKPQTSADSVSLPIYLECLRGAAEFSVRPLIRYYLNKATKMTRLLDVTASLFILIFAMRGTVISATNERSVFTVDRMPEKFQHAHSGEAEPGKRDLVGESSLHYPLSRRISANGEESTGSHKHKVIRAAEQEHSPTASFAKNNAERINGQGFVHDDSASTSDVIRQLSENVDYDEEANKWSESTSKEDLEMYEGMRGDAGPQAKPTKYHYYPHNQHLYLLPECTTQQVCNLVYTRFNFSQPLCACPDRFQGPCSASISRNDQHTLEVVMKSKKKNERQNSRPPTLIKTCEKTKQIRECRAPADWAVLALQNVRTGKSQYLVICNCLRGELDGPMNHEQPAYARVPGIRVYGMMCNSGKSQGATGRNSRKDEDERNKSIQFPWDKALEFASSVGWK